MHDLMLESSRPATGTLSVPSAFDGRELDQIATAGPDHVDDAMSMTVRRDAHMTIGERKWQR